MKSLQSRRKFYSRVFDQAFSPCGRLIAVCDSYGTVSVFSLESVLSASHALESDREVSAENRPLFQLRHFLRAKNEDVSNRVRMYSLVSSDTHLICGDSNGGIHLYRWSDLQEKESGAKPCAQFSGTRGGTPDCPAEVNSMKVAKEGGFMVSGGAGDHHVKLWSLENGSLITSLSGHSDYIHEVALRSDNEILSASEDGTVRFWDIRTGSCSHIVKPGETDCARPNSGSWIGCVAVDDNWMVCGGGTSAGLWHLGSMSLAKVLNSGTADSDTHAAIVVKDKIITGSSKSRIFHWNYRGDLTADVPVSPNTVYSIALNTNNDQFKVLTVAGSSSLVDVMINPGYRAFSLDTFPL